MGIGVNYLNDALATFKNYKKLADKSFAQISDEEFFKVIDAESNSIAVMVKHIANNLKSRWTDFLTTDGEKPSRNRDSEFELYEDDTRQNLVEKWENGWETTFASIESLTVEDLQKTITIRGQNHTVIEAINRSVTHCAYHVGEIVFLAKHLRSSNWQTLSVPRGKTAAFNEFLINKEDKGNRFDAPQEFIESQK
ncbi:MAG: DUF1572 family protein [Pyrinomonadaceae bacterium]|nr:DUF1572 family protein [Pyrinomonadaceae bacterium]